MFRVIVLAWRWLLGNPTLGGMLDYFRVARQPTTIADWTLPELRQTLMYIWFACILKALSVFTGGFVSGSLAGAVGS